MQVMSIFSTPLLFISVITRPQNDAPSFSVAQAPRSSFLPSMLSPKAIWTALFTTLRYACIFTTIASSQTIG